MHRWVVALFAAFISISATAGAWGDGSFDNDDALDWVDRCTKRGSSKLVAATLNKAFGSGEIESADGSAVVVAAEVVAAAKGNPSPQLPPDLRSWLERQAKGELAQLSQIARRALVRVKNSKTSELAQLWEEGKTNRWTQRIAELEERLAK